MISRSIEYLTYKTVGFLFVLSKKYILKFETLENKQSTITNERTNVND